MSRSNYDKPFYVDVGTSMVAIRCASNHDVIAEYDHARFPNVIKLAEDTCDRMNKEVTIGKPPRNCDVGTPEEQKERFCLWCREHGVDREMKAKNCSLCAIKWEQMPYKEGENK